MAILGTCKRRDFFCMLKHIYECFEGQKSAYSDLNVIQQICIETSYSTPSTYIIFMGQFKEKLKIMYICVLWCLVFLKHCHI